jgi:dolichyl-phosphate mannosyltransferase polypeptide 3
MKRHQIYTAIALIPIIVWVCLKLGRGSIADETEKWFVNVSPWYVLMSFGCYCLGRLGFDLLTFNDYPEEINKLEQDILCARTDLKKRGFE